MKRLIYQVYTGKRSKLYDRCTDSVKSYAESIEADYICQTVPKLRIKPDIFTSNRSKESYEKYGGFLPIYEKENAFDLLGEYDQVAIIDADIYIKPNAPDIFFELPIAYDFGAVVESSMPITNEYTQKILNYSQMQYSSLRIDWSFSPVTGFPFMNMGMMVMNKSFKKYLNGQTAKEFLNRGEFKPFIDGMGPWKWSTDQTLLNYWIRKEGMKIKEMNWKWNGLYTANTRIKDCHFVHFFLKDKLPQNGENIEQLLHHIT